MKGNDIRLLVGLGNPGSRYANTRHNIGFMVIDYIAAAHRIPLTKNKFDAIFGRGRIRGKDVLLVKPMAFMNRSGGPTRRVADYYSIPGEEMLVIHDDIDLAFNRLKIKKKGGHGGHNGIKSMTDAFGGGDFSRLRIGIGRPTEHLDVVDHVLGRYSTAEQDELSRIIERAGDAAVTIVCNGVEQGMNLYN